MEAGKYIRFYLGVALLLLGLSGCRGAEARPITVPSTPWPVRTSTSPPAALSPATVTAQPAASATSVPVTPSLPPSATARPTETLVPSATVPPSATALPPSATALPPTVTALPPTATIAPPSATVAVAPPSATVAVAQSGTRCFQPPDDYERVAVRGHTVTRRTLAMLDNAQSLYGGRGSMRLLIQGSYEAGLGASFGTHDGGGAVDIWMVYPDDTSQLLPDIEQAVWALRQSGFAAWFRPANMLYEGMFPHIHAIAVGDAGLSEAAREQIYGEQGYFAGQNGLPQAGFAGPDPHGGPILCPWMEQAQGSGVGAATRAPLRAEACQPPVDEYTRVTVEGQTISQRTYGMLEVAQALYGGAGNLLWVTQGSYSDGVDASFGTHAGGGAVDLSIRHPQTGEFLYDETGRMVQALRQAGFAAWYRTPNQGFTPHIHAIAIGDGELSEAARAQLTGEQGYFRGRNGLPQPEVAGPDPHGGPLLCAWMQALGYADLR